MVLLNYNQTKDMIEDYFHGQYEVLKFLGEGSFAQVFLVKQNFLNDKRAMKIIKEPLSNTKNIDHIFHEVQIASQLHHENILDIYDAGLIGDIAYFVLEYVSGGDLEDYRTSYLKANRPIPIHISLDIIKQILMGLGTLHSSNPIIIHRDLKTKNILMNYGDERLIVKISDFGFARELSSNADDFEVGGTKPYMAPECFNGVFSTRSDVYAVGVIFYLLLAGEFPYRLSDYVIGDIVDGKPWKIDLKPPSHFNQNVPKFVDKLVLKALDVNPNKRHIDAKDFENDLDKAIEKFKEYSYYKEYLNELKGLEELDELDNLGKLGELGEFGELKELEESSRIAELKESSKLGESNKDSKDQDHILNDNILEAFRLAKTEDGLDEASSILEKEVLKDYEIRKTYGKTLRLWKGDYPDAKLISEAFTVTLKGENYKLAIDLLREAFAYNPILKDTYGYYIDLWSIFIDLNKNKDFIISINRLENLMDRNDKIRDIYKDSIDTLKSYDEDRILNEAIDLADRGNLIDASKLLELLVVYDDEIRKDYAYKLSLWKQDLSM
ncbi:serine/threonine protein kinase [Methanobrevibacter ruminantium M1]|uniref:Serine/threonine protein kinase n=1 Tax=Methanobrevibacter ruminantium (strain ATCC 35063 / DSM 1093 / JCM 13430 / OCM 146 / M1) TaxID=634498 RepID=D3E3P5_METRM|nr:serine/threonine protein kinase [Methanobrevibacter ruminantium M1]